MADGIGPGDCRPDRGTAMETRKSKGKQAAGISPRCKAEGVESGDGCGGGGGAVTAIITGRDLRETNWAVTMGAGRDDCEQEDGARDSIRNGRGDSGKSRSEKIKDLIIKSDKAT